MNKALYKTVETINNKNTRYFLGHDNIIEIMDIIGGFKNKTEIIEVIENYSLLNFIPNF